MRPATEFISFPFFGYWGFSYPWYGGGYGWNMGFIGYNPWYYGATRWYWGPYGLWYDPWAYDPYYYGYGGGSYSRERVEKEPETMGSLRIKANPGSAKVYIDNALVGLVEEFSGLNDHLQVEGGRHTVEIRAEGYESYKQDVNVKVGRVQTLRIKLKEKK